MYHSLFVTLWCVCYVIMWLLYHYLFAILSCVCYIINCLLYHQVFSISSSVWLSCVCYIIPCLLYYHMFVISSCVCFIILCLLYCHTRSNLGISALLEILQSCKLDHEVALFSDWYPPTHPPTARSELDYNHWGCV